MRFELSDRIGNTKASPCSVPLGVLKQFSDEVGKFLAGSHGKVDVSRQFSRRQSIQAKLGLHTFVVLPFNVPEAIKAGELAELLARDASDDRKSAAIDRALLAQAERNGVRAILTEDAQTLTRYCDRLRKQGAINCHALLLADGFDPSRMIDPAAPGLTFPPIDD